MSKHVCVICFQPLPRAQRTCGSADCIDAWRNIRSKEGRLKRANLATFTPSERALLEAQAPDEAQPTQEIIDILTAPKPEPAGSKFIRSFLDPTNAPIKEDS